MRNGRHGRSKACGHRSSRRLGPTSNRFAQRVQHDIPEGDVGSLPGEDPCRFPLAEVVLPGFMCPFKPINKRRAPGGRDGSLGVRGSALGLEMALDKCLEHRAALLWASWYLDDGTLVGRVSDLATYFELLLPALRAVGLEVRLDKCTLWGPGAAQVASLCQDHPLCNILVTPFSSESGVTVLGVPVDYPRHSFTSGRSGQRPPKPPSPCSTNCVSFPMGNCDTVYYAIAWVPAASHT